MSRNCSFAGALPLSVRLGSFGLRLFALRACSQDNTVHGNNILLELRVGA